MKRTLLAVLACCFTWPIASASEDVDPAKRALIDELLEVTGALEIGSSMADALVTQMSDTLRRVNDPLPERAFELLEEEIIATINDAVERGTFNKIMYPIYDKYLTSDDLASLLEFYRSDVGRRFTKVLPQMTQESMLAGQQWGIEIGTEAAERVEKRLAAEGIEITD